MFQQTARRLCLELMAGPRVNAEIGGLLRKLRHADCVPWWASGSDWWWALIITKGVAGLPSAMIIKIVILLLSGCLLEVELLDHCEERHNFLNSRMSVGQKE